MPRIIITEPGKSPQPYRLKIERTETKIGRGNDNDIIIEAGSASTHHCVMNRVSGGFILKDLGSTNGIKVAETLFSVIDLEDGMLVQIGDDVTLEFTLTEEEIVELDSEEFEKHQQARLPQIKPTTEVIEELAPDKKRPNEEDEEILEEDYDDEEDSYASAATKRRMMSILFVILAIGALALGFYIRHYQDVL